MNNIKYGYLFHHFIEYFTFFNRRYTREMGNFYIIEGTGNIMGSQL